MDECLISDLSVVEPAGAVSETPERDHWLVIPYEGEVSGKMLWKPARNHPPEVTLVLPAAGPCKVYVGIYSSGTWPIWFNLTGGRSGGSKAYNRVRLRLSDQDWFDTLTPCDYPGQPRFSYISESLWREAELTGQSLILAPDPREAFDDTMTLVAYVRLVPLPALETWPSETKRVSVYMDSNFIGHYVDSEADIRSRIAPLRDSDADSLFWTACREDSCYYPTTVGNVMPPDTMPGVYPYWAGRDMQRMLDRGEDPLAIVCRSCREADLRIYASYRRMTCRLPPFVFPLHPDAMFVKRPDLWCADEQGAPVPHLSLAYPEVRGRMIALLTEQAERYDIDGVHMFFCRGMPFVHYEDPVLTAFRDAFDEDPRALPLDDERVWQIRATFFLQYLKELRSALDDVGGKRNRRFDIAMHVVNSVRTCAYYGMDIRAMVGEGLVDMLVPARGHFFPDALGERHVTPEFLAEFVEIARGTGVRIRPALETSYWDDGLGEAGRAALYYGVGADGMLGGARGISRYLGHEGKLDAIEKRLAADDRMVGVTGVGGFPINMNTGIPTVG